MLLCNDCIECIDFYVIHYINDVYMATSRIDLRIDFIRSVSTSIGLTRQLDTLDTLDILDTFNTLNTALVRKGNDVRENDGD